MELIFYFAVVIAVGSFYYAVCCFLFFLFTRRPLLLAFTQSWKYSIASIVGVIALGFGAILLPWLMLNGKLEQLPNYSKWRDIGISLIICSACSVSLLFTAWGLAFTILD